MDSYGIHSFVHFTIMHTSNCLEYRRRHIVLLYMCPCVYQPWPRYVCVFLYEQNIVYLYGITFILYVLQPWRMTGVIGHEAAARVALYPRCVIVMCRSIYACIASMAIRVEIVLDILYLLQRILLYLISLMKLCCVHITIYNKPSHRSPYLLCSNIELFYL